MRPRPSWVYVAAAAVEAAGGIAGAWLQGWSPGGISWACVTLWAVAFAIQTIRLARLQEGGDMDDADKPAGYRCPGCGQPPAFMIGDVRAMCGNESCAILMWDPRRSPRELMADMCMVNLWRWPS